MSRTSQSMSVGWIDLGEEDQRRAREYLAQFNTDNTLDELGFGILRDAFADVFFPATNTIMTRTRYLIFVPALCLIVEREKLSGAVAANRLTQLENQLRESLETEEERDVIGRLAKESLRRYPSSIYWNALRRLGVFLRPGWGLSYYHSHLSQCYASRLAERDDDGLSHLTGSEQGTWDKGIKDLVSDGLSILDRNCKLPSSLNFVLTRAEAKYLRDKFSSVAVQDGRPSILSYLLEQRAPATFGYPWDAPHPPSLTAYVSHARCLSMLVRGATLQYFHLLVRERQLRAIAAPGPDVSDAFALWWEATHRDLGRWRIDEFLGLATQIGGLRRSIDGMFLKEWLQLATTATDGPSLLNNPKAHESIRRRERSIRPNKSRLYHTEYLQRWTPPKATDITSTSEDANRVRYELNFRAPIGSTFVQDITGGTGEHRDV